MKLLRCCMGQKVAACHASIYADAAMRKLTIAVTMAVSIAHSCLKH